MRIALLLGSSLLALTVGLATARADAITYTGATVTYIVPTTGTYDITAFGAQGGSGLGVYARGVGGLGAEIGGDFTLTANEILNIAVGGQGGSFNHDSGGGGGGGTFVVGPNAEKLVIAAGGGGAYFLNPGAAGQTTNGYGGNGGNSGAGGGGGGFASGGANGRAGGGGGYPSLVGGTAQTGTTAGSGGFGGGGGGGFLGGGGGGGYGGGHGGLSTRGGGGYSFDSGTNQVLISGENTGNGLVDITLLQAATQVPEPGSAALLATGLLGLGLLRRRRTRT